MEERLKFFSSKNVKKVEWEAGKKWQKRKRLNVRNLEQGVVVERVISGRATAAAVGGVKLLRLEDEGETLELPADEKGFSFSTPGRTLLSKNLMFTFIGLEQHLLVHSPSPPASLFSLEVNVNVPSTSWVF